MSNEVINEYSNDISRYIGIEKYASKPYASLDSISRFHRWWAEDKTVGIEIDSDVFLEIINEKMREYNTRSVLSLYN